MVAIIYINKNDDILRYDYNESMLNGPYIYQVATKCTNLFYIVTKNSDGNYYVATSSEFSFDIGIIIIDRKFFLIGRNEIDHQVNLVKEYFLIE